MLLSRLSFYCAEVGNVIKQLSVRHANARQIKSPSKDGILIWPLVDTLRNLESDNKLSAKGYAGQFDFIVGRIDV